jgi:hypothetical protein
MSPAFSGLESKARDQYKVRSQHEAGWKDIHDLLSLKVEFFITAGMKAPNPTLQNTSNTCSHNRYGSLDANARDREEVFEPRMEYTRHQKLELLQSSSGLSIEITP